jgi:transcriptional regulator with XRE-family HTH domain
MPATAKDRNASKKPGEMDLYIGGRLRLWRRTMGIDGYALAERIGITYQQLQKYEKGMNRISATRLYAIAKDLNVPIDYFYQNADVPHISAGAAIGEGSEPYDLLTNGSGADFLRWYVSIKDPVVKKALVNLMRSIAAPPQVAA